MNKEQSPLISGITYIHCGLLLSALATIMFVNPSFIFAGGNFLVNFSVAAVFIAVVTAFFISGYNKVMLGRDQIKVLGRVKYVIVALNVSLFVVLGVSFFLPPIYIYNWRVNMLLLVVAAIIELISAQYYKKLSDKKT